MGVLFIARLKVAVTKTVSFSLRELSGWLWVKITVGGLKYVKVILSTAVSFPSWAPEALVYIFPAISLPLTVIK